MSNPWVRVKEMKIAFPLNSRVQVTAQSDDAYLIAKKGAVVDYDGLFEWIGVALDDFDFVNWFPEIDIEIIF